MRLCDIYFRRQILLVVLLTILAVCTITKLASYTGILNGRTALEYKWERPRNARSSYLSDSLSFQDQQQEGIEYAPTRCGSSRTSPIGASHEFLAHQPFNLPDDYIRPLEEILTQDWVCDLEDFLSTVDQEKRLVNIIAGNSNFTEPLLNWLIGVTLRLEEPMVDWIVVSLDEPLHYLLRKWGIPSLLVTPESVMYTSNFPESYHRHNGIYQARMIVMRLINQWGYNCANYDTDALILKNPQPIYDSPMYSKVDIFAGFAISFPPALHKIWGATLCNGAMMIRSNPRTELFWENVALTPNAGCERGMDQCKFNYAFYRMKLNWTTTAESVKKYTMDSVWRAHGDVEVFILPLSTICRQRFCVEEEIDKYYIWHKGSRAKTAEAKRESVEVGNLSLWWLRDDWREISEGVQVQAQDWLQLIANTSSF